MKEKHTPSLVSGVILMVLSVMSVTAYDLSTDKVTYIVTESHLDTQWQWTLEGTISTFLPNTMYRNFDLFDMYPTYVFNFEGAYRYMLMKQHYPEEYEILKGFVAKGNWAPVGAFVDASDVNIPSPESVVRQILYGNGFFREEFGKKSIDILLPDCFGFGYALPTVAAHCGLKGFSTQKFDVWGGFRPTPFSIGRWKGVDGSVLVSALKPGSYSDLQWDIRANEGDALKASSGIWATYDYFGVGDQGGGNEDGAVSSLMNRIKDNGNQDVKVVLAPADQIFRDLTPAQVNTLPLYDGELLMQTHGTGAYTAHADIKMRNHINEVLAYAAEEASVIAEWGAGSPYPREAVKKSWIRVLWNQNHDGITGTSIPDAYTKYAIPALDSSQAEFTAALASANTAVASTLDTRVSDPSSIPVVVYNPLSADRLDLATVAVSFTGAVPAEMRVFDGAGSEVPSQKTAVVGQTMLIVFMASAPASGYAVYELRPSTTACPINTGLNVGTSFLENSQYFVSIDANGDISSIKDKRNGNRELLDKPSRLEMRNNSSERWPSWEVLYKDVSAAPRGYVDGSVQATVMERGPARVSVQVTRTKDGSSFTQQYRLTADTAGYVEVTNDILWNSSATMLKAGFPLTASNPKATFDLGVGVIERPNMNSGLYEVPAQQWADISNADNSFGTAVLADYKRGWDKFNDNTLHLTLIHTPSGTNYGYSGDRFQHKFSYGIYGHRGNWNEGGVVWQGMRFNQPLRVRKVAPAAGPGGKTLSFIEVDPTKIAVMALKKSEQGDEYIVRIREIAGSRIPQPVTLTFPSAPAVTSARELTGFEEDSVPEAQRAGVTASGNTISLTIGRFQIKTIAITLGTSSAVRRNSTSLSGKSPAIRVRQLANGTVSIDLSRVGVTVRDLRITDAGGRIVRMLPVNPRSGNAAMSWDGTDSAGKGVRAGTYFVRLDSQTGHLCRSVTLMRR